eukprot:scaffold297251_cov26-Tisochrysis_lutea.AAC.6
MVHATSGARDVALEHIGRVRHTALFPSGSREIGGGVTSNSIPFTVFTLIVVQSLAQVHADTLEHVGRICPWRVGGQHR